ncbi:NADH-quinone oxidoreductase subunit L [Sphingoaurantiacus capsulatus]|uniref:NADH-quinone oxidoreductase subunit L n=1 Tax=Sphingoaurantiacus capsulatus TaxID=1771310 RepID=A0ABV7XGQ9_9SPHN
MIQLIVFLPLLAALVAGLGQRALGHTGAKLVTTGGLFISAALSWVTFFDVAIGGNDHTVRVLEWISSGNLQIDWALRVDTLTAVMLVVITTVSALVHLYSWGYMSEDPDQPRFFAYLSLFTFAMLMLVTADNLVQMFFGWEGVGLASYLLIGFWYQKPSANAAAIKAFVVNRVGDFGFSLGIFAAFLVFGTIDITTINEGAAGFAGQSFTFLGYQVDVMTTICLLLFVGAMGKSAQLGLHTWLPDAMEGPTPVSALIHAATMVTAGVFMVCRLSPMFEAAPVALTVVTYVGAATALFAATVGTVQTDIKRVIAYSTCSQLGYMFFAAGVGAYGVAMFHLFTHAFFKALLFLGAGSVIHAMHHEQDMRFYGGLRRDIPITFAAMMLGTLAITGVVPFAGYFSKDAILEAAFASGTEAGVVAFFVGIFAALLTSFYSWRLILLTFTGKPRWAGSEHIQHAVHHHDEPAAAEGSHEAHGHAPAHAHNDHHHAPGTAGYHPHESPWAMLIPLIVLGAGAAGAGWLFHHAFIEDAGFWRDSIAFNAELIHALHNVPAWVIWAPAGSWVLGMLLALNSYYFNPSIPGRFVATFPGLHQFLLKKWYFDELYHFIFVRPAFWLGRQFWRRGDQGTIDRFGPDGVAALVEGSAAVARRLQTGYVYTYALVMLIGLAAAATWFLPRVFGGH